MQINIGIHIYILEWSAVTIAKLPITEKWKDEAFILELNSLKPDVVLYTTYFEAVHAERY